MKALTTCVVAIAVMCVSCKDVNPAQTPNALPSNHQYLLVMSFLDADGNDLVEGIKGTEPDGSIQANFVAPDEYILDSSLPHLPNSPYAILDDPDPTPELILVLHEGSGVEPSHYALYFDTPVARAYELMEEITYTLVCPHVFGDGDEHEIVTHWRKPTGWNESWAEEGRDSYRTCYRVVVDGVEAANIAYTMGEQLSHATIVLDR